MNKDELIPLVRIQIKFKASILEGGNIKWKYAKKDVKLKLAIIRVYVEQNYYLWRLTT